MVERSELLHYNNIARRNAFNYVVFRGDGRR